MIEANEPAPAGASQLGMLWHEQLAPGSFNLPCLVRRYRGRLDVDAFASALSELARRHEPLRTTFAIEASGPHLMVQSSGAALEVLDLSGLPLADGDAATADLIADASGRPFDLAEGPLFAPHLAKLATDDHLLVVRLHHTAFDDWSVDVFRRELSVLYASFLSGEPHGLPSPKRFSDVCRQQQTQLDGATGAAESAWWRQQMEGAPFAVQLPLGRPEELGPDREGAGEPLRRDLGTDLAQQVRALARRLRATPFMTVLAAFGVLLARRTGQDDLVLASVVSGRTTPDEEPMIGCFTKKVLLRLRLDGDPTFAEIVARTRGTVLDALAHQVLPFDAVVQEAWGHLASAHGIAPQVPVVFQGETPQLARLALPGIRSEPYEAPAAARRERHFSASRGDGDGDTARPRWGDGAYLGTFLILSLLEREEGLGLVARGVFHRPAARQLLEDLEALLEEIVATPEANLPVGRPASAPGPEQLEGEVCLRGLRLTSSRIEDALARCPGVGQVALAVTDNQGEPALTAYVVPDRRPAPTLAQLRAALWSALPGSPWPAAAVIVDALPRRDGAPLDPAGLAARQAAVSEVPAPDAALLASLWSAARGHQRATADSYWQDFAFLQAVTEARAAGLPITDDQLMRCRTPEMLAAALAAESGP